MKVRAIRLDGDADSWRDGVDLSSKIIELPALSVKAVKAYLTDEMEVEEEEGACLDEMFVFTKKGPVVTAVSQEDFLVFTFVEV